MRYIGLYQTYIRTFIVKMFEYRADFIIGIFSILLQQIILLSSINIIFNNIQTFDDYNKSDLLFMYGLSTLGSSICYTFFDGLWTIGGQYIKKGLLDRVLLRPVNPLFQIIAERIKLEGFASIFLGISIIIYSGSDYVNISSPLDVIVLLILILSSTMIFASILLIVSSLAFWIIDSLSIMQLVNNFAEYGRYPISIYPKYLSILLTFILPYAFTSFYPSTFFVDRDGYYLMALLTPVISVVLFLLGILIWNLGLKKYGSSGT